MKEYTISRSKESMYGQLSVNVPQEMKDRDQWIGYQITFNEKTDRWDKKPVHALTGNPGTQNGQSSWQFESAWVRFDQALHSLVRERPPIDGIGIVLAKGIGGLDLDGCVDPATGKIDEWAQALIDRFATYTEYSFSRRGVHGYFTIDRELPKGTHKQHIELYSSGRGFVVTGHHVPGTPRALRNCTQGAFDLYAELNPPPLKTRQESPLHPPYSPHNMDTDELFALASTNQRFMTLWNGEVPPDGEGKSASEIDWALVTTIAWYVGPDRDRIDAWFRKSSRYWMRHTKWNSIRTTTTYGWYTIDRALSTMRAFYNPNYTGPHDTHKRTEHEVYDYGWQHARETTEEREAYLLSIAQAMKERVERHSKAGCEDILVLASPPGTGKSSSVAELGEHLSVAWIAERHDMIEHVDALQKWYQEMQPCSDENCHPYFVVHEELAKNGYNTRSLHEQHNIPCSYVEQFKGKGSKVYQLAHVHTTYPAGHQAIIVDEMNLNNWLPQHEITSSKLLKAAGHFDSGSTALSFVQAAMQVLARAEHEGEAMQGKAVFDVLDTYCANGLEATLDELAQDAQLMAARPWTDIDLYVKSPEEAAKNVRLLPPIVLPPLVKALRAEMEAWKIGQEWNSRVGIKKTGRAWGFLLTNPLFFVPRDGKLPPVSILDATADREIFARLFHGHTVRIEREEVTPPPGIRHIAVRTGKRYGKRSMEGKGGEKHIKRVIAECRYLLAQIASDDEQERVGMVTYMGVKDEIGESLGIPEERRLHFWGCRGSNALDDCTILLVIGTPTIHPDDVAHVARALYSGKDEPPLDVASTRNEEGWTYVDPRMQHVNDYLIRAELTQCAHRSRALRHDKHVVVSFCAAEIDFLPVTEVYSVLPQLSEAGDERSVVRNLETSRRIEEAVLELQSAGVRISVRSIQEKVRIKMETIRQWLKEHRIDHVEHESVSRFGINISLYQNGIHFEHELDSPTTPQDDPSVPTIVPAPLSGSRYHVS